MAAPRKVSCSGCGDEVTLRPNEGVVVARKRANATRGRLYKAAHNVKADLFFEEKDGDVILYLWDCPLCQYADSLDVMAYA